MTREVINPPESPAVNPTYSQAITSARADLRRARCAHAAELASQRRR
jgi:hypothetical protein